MTIEKDFFRQVMGHFATGVTVVTTSNQGVVSGLTVNAFCSVSLNPPLVLICIDIHSTAMTQIRESGAFAVNMLTEQQEDLSRCFATQSDERFKHFCHASYHAVATGAPVLADVLAFVDARVVAEYPGGDHSIFLGQVEALGIGGKVLFADAREAENATDHNGQTPPPDEAPLTYYLGHYRRLADAYRTPSMNKPVGTTQPHSDNDVQ
ncbi:MAG: flavin reductase family protein [Ktedonobacteraceae bacterium]|nr:flavin reductase family protein [Ktedonobacteraceae bacterium]